MSEIWGKNLTKLVFKNGEALKRLAIGTEQAMKFRIPYTEKHTKQKGFVFVKDEGIYLMNAYAGGMPPNELGTVVYADSFDPNKDKDVWNRSYEAVGGDDFAEFIEVSQHMLTRIIHGLAKKITIDMTSDSYSVEV
jgi:hypothetical protein